MAHAVVVIALGMFFLVMFPLVVRSAEADICFRGCRRRRSESCAVENAGFYNLWWEFHQHVFTGPHGLKDALEANLMCAECHTARSSSRGHPSIPLCLEEERFVVVKGHNFRILSDDVLKPFQKVISLSFLEANVTDVSTGALARLRNLEFLGILNNNLPVLEQGSFSLPETRWLSLRQNKIHTIEPRAFDGSRHLALLDLHGNDLHVVMGTSFRGLTSLTSLDLGSNRIKYVTSRAFESLTSLESLSLDSNELGAVKKHWFCGLSRLEVLSLEKNRITEIDQGSFQALQALRSLELSSNKLTYVHAYWFHNMTSLEKLSLADNRIIAGADGSLTGLTIVLDLCRNPLRCTCASRWLRGLGLDSSRRPTCVYPFLWRSQNRSGHNVTLPCPLAALPTSLMVSAFPTSLLSAPPVSFHYTYTATCRLYWERQPQLVWMIGNEKGVNLPSDLPPGQKTTLSVSMATFNVTATMEHSMSQKGWPCRRCITLNSGEQTDNGNSMTDYLGKTVSTVQVRTHRAITPLDCVAITEDKNLTIPTAASSQQTETTAKPSLPPSTTASYLTISKQTPQNRLLTTTQRPAATTSHAANKERDTDQKSGSLSCVLIALLASAVMGLLTGIPSLCVIQARKRKGRRLKMIWQESLRRSLTANKTYADEKEGKVNTVSGDDNDPDMLTPNLYEPAHEYETCPSPALRSPVTSTQERRPADRKSTAYTLPQITGSDCGMYKQEKDDAVPADPNAPPLEVYKTSDVTSNDEGASGETERESSPGIDCDDTCEGTA
ncbi:LRIG2 [Branchiostoma lanceolatum]|uniref:LRIG2 protein n=1 Tax=Branchiostoma lanceolatum TaxID=7740 RepID=A0A8J9YX76_BRALA|nr:LRIG2 [Branchiostoma lanceolatum]